jgi:hypothetical protein
MSRRLIRGLAAVLLTGCLVAATSTQHASAQPAPDLASIDAFITGTPARERDSHPMKSARCSSTDLRDEALSDRVRALQVGDRRGDVAVLTPAVGVGVAGASAVMPDSTSCITAKAVNDLDAGRPSARRIRARPGSQAETGQGGEELASLYAAAAGGTAELWRVPGSTHVGGLDAAPDQYEQRVIDFFDRALLGSRP